MIPAELSFGAAVIVGLLGSSHCIGMCGGIVSALTMGVDDRIGQRPRSMFAYHLGYNGGRIASYVLVGLLAGAAGAGLVRLGVSPLAGKLFASAFMIALGLYLANWWRGLAVLERLGQRLWRHIQPLGQRLFPIRNPAQAFLLGMLWGWLPCGLVYAVVAWALTTGDTWQAALLMLGFGIGTLPALLIAGNAFHYVSTWIKSPLVRTGAGILIIGFGVYSGVAGLTRQHQQHHTAFSPAEASGALLHPETASTRTPAILRRVS